MQESRFEALHAGALTPLVGREEESELLLRRWARAKAGEGQVVLLSGEAGIGKSRLTAAFLERLAGEPHVRLRYFCSPQHADSALYPIIGHMERAARLSREDDAKTRLDKLDALLAQNATSREEAALLAEMLSLPNDGRYPALDLAPQQRRQKTMEALTRQVEAIAHQSGVLMIFEDAYWTDPSSLELLGRLVDKIDALRVLLFVTFRPEFTAPWIGRPHVTALTINRLAPRDVTALIGGVAGNRPLAEHIRQDIVERADGIPLFVEEMTKAVLEAGSEGGGGDDRDSSVSSSGGARQPARLVDGAARPIGRGQSDSADRRGDRAGVFPCAARARGSPARTGAEFPARPACPCRPAVAPRRAAARDLYVQARAGAGRCLWHATAQSAARVAAQLAAALETQFPELVAAQPELLAHHSTEAGLTAQAVDNWRRAGELAIERSANLEAISHLSRGLQILKTLPESRQRHEQELVFQAALLAPHWASKGFASPAARQVAARAEELCQRVGGHLSEHIRALWGLAVFHLCCGELRIGFAAGERCLHLAGQLQDRSLLGHAQFLMGNLLFWFAELVRARGHLEQGIALYDPERARIRGGALWLSGP